MTYVWVVEELPPYDGGIFLGVTSSAALGKRLAKTWRDEENEWECTDPAEDNWECGDLYVTRYKVVEE